MYDTLTLGALLFVVSPALYMNVSQMSVMAAIGHAIVFLVAAYLLSEIVPFWGIWIIAVVVFLAMMVWKRSPVVQPIYGPGYGGRPFQK